MSKISVLKIGGNIINSTAELAAALEYFASLRGPKILVHGGGRKASELMQRLDIIPKMTNGRRITDAASLEVVTMVYAGLLNKNIVAQLQARQLNALGLSGADGDLIRAHRRPVGAIDYGFAGDVDTVNVNWLLQLLERGVCPVICPITHNGQGQLLNTNADTMASEVARGLAAAGKSVSLQFCFELPGVLEDIQRMDSVISHISPLNYPELLSRGVIAGGIQPKLENALAAVEAGVGEVVIADLARLKSGEGTRITDGKA